MSAIQRTQLSLAGLGQILGRNTEAAYVDLPDIGVRGMRELGVFNGIVGYRIERSGTVVRLKSGDVILLGGVEIEIK